MFKRSIHIACVEALHFRCNLKHWKYYKINTRAQNQWLTLSFPKFASCGWKPHHPILVYESPIKHRKTIEITIALSWSVLMCVHLVHWIELKELSVRLQSLIHLFHPASCNEKERTIIMMLDVWNLLGEIRHTDSARSGEIRHTRSATWLLSQNPLETKTW